MTATHTDRFRLDPGPTLRSSPAACAPGLHAVVLCTLLLCAYPSEGAIEAHSEKSSEAEQVARRLIAAFNEHKPQEMADTVSDDFQLFYVSGPETELGLEGPMALREEMKSYFSNFPDVHSTVEEVTRAGSFVSFRERVRWTQEGKEQSQFSLAVYEVRDGKILRVWYYPAER